MLTDRIALRTPSSTTPPVRTIEEAVPDIVGGAVASPDYRSSAEPAPAGAETGVALATRRHRLGADRHAREEHQVRVGAAPEVLPVADGLRTGHEGFRY
jgi:hypothetical protein